MPLLVFLKEISLLFLCNHFHLSFHIMVESFCFVLSFCFIFSESISFVITTFRWNNTFHANLKKYEKNLFSFFLRLFFPHGPFSSSFCFPLRISSPGVVQAYLLNLNCSLAVPVSPWQPLSFILILLVCVSPTPSLQFIKSNPKHLKEINNQIQNYWSCIIDI